MAFCKKCGKELDENSKFCPECGEPAASENASSNKASDNIGETIRNLNNTADITSSIDAADIEDNKILALISYLSWLVIIPIFAAPKSKFARFHANQGLVLFIAEAALGVISSVLSTIFLFIIPPVAAIIGALSGLLGLASLVLVILGIVNAATGKAKELPVIGKIKILK